MNRYVYDAFGNRTVCEEKIANRFGYAGEMYDGITQQYYLRARFYNPIIGRFTQEDTYYGDGLNLYEYGRNNPMRYIDPSGHEVRAAAEKNYVNRAVDAMNRTADQGVDGMLERVYRGKDCLENKIGYGYLDDQLGGLKDSVTINQYQSAESVNDWWEARGYKSPYKEKTVVQNISLTEDTKFVRTYDGVNSNLEGGWIMRTEDISGLTPKDIQAKFALEFEPKYIGEVELKAGDTVRLGEVGPNFGFYGSGIQIDLQQQWIGDYIELGKIEDWR